MTIMFRTYTGSLYRVEEREGRFFLAADNVANPNSSKLDPMDEYEIERPEPWPIVVGLGVYMPSIYPIGEGGDQRPLGGGKYTSPVTEILEQTP